VLLGHALPNISGFPPKIQEKTLPNHPSSFGQPHGRRRTGQTTVVMEINRWLDPSIIWINANDTLAKDVTRFPSHA
jgi:hypothetical protein